MNFYQKIFTVNLQIDIEFKHKTQGHPTTIFGNICSEDDLRSRIFGTFVVKFLACLPNI